MKNFYEIFKSAESLMPPYPFWKTYYEHRYVDFLVNFKSLPEKQYAKILEIGCGGGYHSAFLSSRSEKVVATDLENPDPRVITPGLKGAKELHEKLGIKNIELIAASAEDLPFEDHSFDMVYSAHCLEHVPDKERAVNEIMRVLKPGGINFCVLPTSSKSFYSFFSYWWYLFHRSIYHLVLKRFKKRNIGKNSANDQSLASMVQKKALFENFPFPACHGSDSHYLKELTGWTLGGWEKVLTANSKYRLMKLTTSDHFSPFSSMLSVVSPKLGVKLHRLVWKLDFYLGKIPFIKYLGTNAIYIVKKEK